MQPPLTAIGARHSALFLGLAYRQLHQPEAADRALHPLTRTAGVLRHPAWSMRRYLCRHCQPAPGHGCCWGLSGGSAQRLAGITHALGTLLACLAVQELGLALWRTGYRQAAIACHEDGLKAILHQWGIWDDPRRSDWLRGPSLLTALENLPLHTWSATIQGEMLRLLQGLAWLYNHEALRYPGRGSAGPGVASGYSHRNNRRTSGYTAAGSPRQRLQGVSPTREWFAVPGEHSYLRCSGRGLTVLRRRWRVHYRALRHCYRTTRLWP